MSILKNIRPKLSPMPQQLEYIEFGKNKSHIPCIMEMRLGKTLANIWLVQQWCKQVGLWEHTTRHTKNGDTMGLSASLANFPCLIVCPAPVIETWERELSTENEQFIVVSGTTFNKRTADSLIPFNRGTGRMWVIINYESLLYTPKIANLPWFTVILDESVVIKNPKAKITKLCCSSFQDVEHRIIMSGLPSPEGELNLFQQYYFLYRDFMGYNNYYQYRAGMFEMMFNPWNRKVQGYYCTRDKARQISKYVHNKSFIRTMKECGLGNKRIKEFRKISMTSEQRRVYDKIEKEFVSLVDRGEHEELTRVETDHVLTQRLWLSRLSGGCDTDGNFKYPAKSRDLLYLLKEEFFDKPVIVWFKLNAELFAIEEILKKNKIVCQTLTGQDDRLQKKMKQEWFRDTKGQRVILVQSERVAKYGVDMSVCSTAIKYSYTYSGDTEAQINARMDNAKKNEPLLTVYLITENSIDEDIIEVVRDKVRSAKLFLKKTLDRDIVEKMKERWLKRNYV
jgi:hypothetical protein